MPIYEYECKKCNLVWEAIRPVSMRNDPLECPCGEQCEHVVSVPAPAEFKGEGFTEKFYPRLDK